MKIKYRDPCMEMLVNVNPGEVVLYGSKYYLRAENFNVEEATLVDIESGKILYIDNAVRVLVCKEATMNPLLGYDAEESEC